VPGQQPGLVVEGVGVHQATRAAKGDGQSPGLAAAHLRPTVPGHPHPPGQAQPFDGGGHQFEAHHAAVLLRQADHLPLQPAGGAVQRRVEPVVEGDLGTVTGPGEADQGDAQRSRPPGQQHRADARQPQQQPTGRQRRQEAQRQQPAGQGQPETSHPLPSLETMRTRGPWLSGCLGFVHLSTQTVPAVS